MPAGDRVRYRLRVDNTSTRTAEDVRVRVRFSRAARRVRGRRAFTLRLSTLASGARHTHPFALRARRAAAGRSLTVSARVIAADDADKSNDRAVDRNRVRPGAGRAANALARAVLRMPALRSPDLPAETRTPTSTAIYRGLCRLVPGLAEPVS